MNTVTESLTSMPVGIVGAGSIGIAFAVLFSKAGTEVRIFDPDAARRAAVPAEVLSRLESLAEFDLLPPPGESVSAIGRRVTVVDSMADAAIGVALVQECAPEQLELKRTLFAELDRLAERDAILASSSSALTASLMADGLPGHERCLVAHPGNPPYLLPVIELVPAGFTAKDVVARAQSIYERAGLRTVRVGREVEGFVFNRLQGALLREAYCLVRDGVASVEDIDTVVREALGLRWSVIGPFETVDLNTRGGIASHAKKMGPAYERMGAERGQFDPWTHELVQKVEQQRRERLPLDAWDSRVAWRDRELMRLLRTRATARYGEQEIDTDTGAFLPDA